MNFAQMMFELIRSIVSFRAVAKVTRIATRGYMLLLQMAQESMFMCETFATAIPEADQGRGAARLATKSHIELAKITFKLKLGGRDSIEPGCLGMRLVCT